MSDTNRILDATANAAYAVGRGLATAGRWIARKAGDGWEAIDPDLRSHLMQLPVVALTQLAARGTSVAAMDDDGHHPIVFVHGFGGAPGNFLPLRAWLWLQGRKRTYAFQLPPGCALDQTAEALSEYLRAVIRVNALPAEAKIDLVAHSMGGVVARLALEQADTRQRVGTLVTLGSPHAGSHLARYANTSQALDLRPGSPVLRRLDAQLPWAGPPVWPRLVAFWSQADVVVIPADSARVEGAKNIELPGFTHYSYLVRPEAWRHVHDALGTQKAGVKIGNAEGAVVDACSKRIQGPSKVGLANGSDGYGA
jgi:pimeloyl-ACP methyl ester carboxylesterase